MAPDPDPQIYASEFLLMDPDSNPDEDPDPSIFIMTFKMPTKTNFFKNVFLHITFCRYFYIIFQRNKLNRSHKTVEVKVFLTTIA